MYAVLKDWFCWAKPSSIPQLTVPLGDACRPAKLVCLQLVQKEVQSKLLELKGKRINRQRRALMKSLVTSYKPGEHLNAAAFEESLHSDGPLSQALQDDKALGKWFHDWYRSLVKDPDYAHRENQDFIQVNHHFIMYFMHQ